MNILQDFFKTYGIPGIAGVVVAAVILWFIADRIAKPGTEVSVLWGLVKYNKKGGEPTKPAYVGGGFPVVPLGITDIKITDIKAEATTLLGVTRSIPGGLWLAAESVSTGREALLQTAQQIKPEHRAEALAHLSQALTVFNRAKDAHEVAERSLAAVTDVPETMQSFAWSKLAEKFLEADLTPFAQQAAQRAVELTLEKARTSKIAENFRHVTQIYSRAFSPDEALWIARTISDPKGQAEALSAIIAQYSENENTKEAAILIEEALTVSKKILKASDRANAFADRAREWMRIGRYNEAAKTARQAKLEAQQINPQELFGELMIKSINNDMRFLEAQPLAVLQAAETQRNPLMLTYLAKFLPRRAQETVQIARSAMNLAVQARLPDALAEAAQLLDAAGVSKEAQQAAQKTVDLALNAADRRFRDLPLQKAAEILSKGGNYENALSAGAGISTAKQGAETILRVLIYSYARTGKSNARAMDILHRLQTACATLDDKDRSAAMMQLASGMAFQGTLDEAFQVARQAPLSGHRLSAYAVIRLATQMQSLPEAEAAKIHTTRGEAFEKMLLPIFSWDLAS